MLFQKLAEIGHVRGRIGIGIALHRATRGFKYLADALLKSSRLC